MKLSAKAFGLTIAVLASAFWLVAMTISILTGLGEETLTTWGSWHPYFSYSWGGLFVMVIEHFVGGFIFGGIFAWLYNKLSSKNPQI
jgi:hypothetical protein